MYLNGVVLPLSVDFNGVANLNSKERKITCQPMSSTTHTKKKKFWVLRLKLI